jgi:hypothetical protein
MTWTLKASTQTNTVVGTTTSAIDTTGSDLIVITSGGWLVTAPTDNKGNTYLLAYDENTASVRPYSYIWYCHNPVVGTGHTFTFANNAQVTTVAAWSGSTTGATVLDQKAAGFVLGTTSTTAFATGPITPSVGGCLVIANWAIDDPAESSGFAGFSVNNGFTLGPGEDEASGSYFGCVTAYLAQTTAASVSCTLTRATALTQTGQPWVIVSFIGATTTSNYSLSAAEGSFATTGEPQGLSHGYRVSAVQASFATTGETVGWFRGRNLPAVAGVYSTSLRTATLSHGKTLSAAQGSFTLSGFAAALNSVRTMLCAETAFSFVGQAQATSFGRHLPAAQGSYAIAGENQVFHVGRNIPAVAGTFSYIGPFTSLSHGITLNAAQGTLALSGQAQPTRYGRTIPAAQGTFNLFGTTTPLKYGRRMAAAQGAFALTGFQAALARSGQKILTAQAGSFSVFGTGPLTGFGRGMIAAEGAFSVSGQAQAVNVQRKLSAAQGSLALTGKPQGVSWGHLFRAAQGAFALFGEPQALARKVRMSAAQGAFALTGETVSFQKSSHFFVPAAAGSFTLVGFSQKFNVHRVMQALVQFFTIFRHDVTMTPAGPGITVVVPVTTVTYVPRTQPIIAGGETKFFRDELLNISKAIKAANAAIHSVNSRV